jgi:hypothetical protein
VKAWAARIKECVNLFNKSPLAQRLKLQYSFQDFLRVLKGMNGDHASTEKGTAKGMEGLKAEEAVKELGEQALMGKAIMDLVLYLSAWNAVNI